MLTRPRTIGAKVEATEGIAETIAGADIFYAGEVKFSPNVEEWVRNIHRDSLSPLSAGKGRRRGSMAFKTEWMGSGTAGAVPFWSPLIQACGRSETVVGGTSVTYDHATTSLKSATIKAFLDGISVTIKGARGSLSLSMKAGEPPMATWTFEGLWDPFLDADDWKDEATLAGSALPTFPPKPFAAALLRVDSYAAIVETVNISDNAILTPVPDANTAGIYTQVLLTGRRLSGDMDIQAVLVATKDFMSLLYKKTEFAVTLYVGADESGANGSGSLNTLTDNTKNWPTDRWLDTSYSLQDSAGTVFAITDSDATTVTVSGTPANGAYIIYEAGKLIYHSMPQCVLTDLSDDDKNGVYTFGAKFNINGSTSGDDEETIKLT